MSRSIHESLSAVGVAPVILGGIGAVLVVLGAYFGTFWTDARTVMWILGLGLGGVAGLVILAGRSTGGRSCPHCAERIRREAVICRFCGRDVGPGALATPGTTGGP